MSNDAIGFELSLGAVHLLSEEIVSLLKADAASGLSCSHLQSLLVQIEHLLNLNEAILPNPADLKRSEYSIEQLLEIGLSFEGFKQAGYSLADLKTGFKRLLGSDLSKARLERLGYTVPQLLAVDLSFQMLMRAGYTYAELNKPGVASEANEVAESFNAVESSADLKRAGHARLLAELSQNSYFSWKYRPEVVRETFCQISSVLKRDCTQDECNLLYQKFSADSFKRVFSMMRWLGLRVQVLQFMQDFMFSESIDAMLEEIQKTSSYQLYQSFPNAFAVDKPDSVLSLKMFEGTFPLNLSEYTELMAELSGSVTLTEAMHDTKNVTVSSLTKITSLHQILLQSSVSVISEILVFHHDRGKVHLRVDDPEILGAILQEELVCVVPVHYAVGQILTKTDLRYLRFLGYERVWVKNGASVEKLEGHSPLSYAEVSSWVQSEVQEWRVSHKKMGVPDAEVRIIESVIADLYAGWKRTPQFHQDHLKKLELWCVYVRILQGDDVIALNGKSNGSVHRFIFQDLKEYLCVNSDELPFSAAVEMVRLNYNMFSELCYSIFEVSDAQSSINVRLLYSDADCEALYSGVTESGEGSTVSEQMRIEVLTALTLSNQRLPRSVWKNQKMVLGKSFLDALYWSDLGKFETSHSRDLYSNGLKSLKDLAFLPEGFTSSQMFYDQKIDSINEISKAPISILPEEARIAILAYLLPGDLTPYGVIQFYQNNMAKAPVTDESCMSKEAVAAVLSEGNMKTDVLTLTQSKISPDTQQDQGSVQTETFALNVEGSRLPAAEKMQDGLTQSHVSQGFFKRLFNVFRRHQVLVASMLLSGCLVGLGSYYMLVISMVNIPLLSVIQSIFPLLTYSSIVAALVAGIAAFLVVPLCSMLIQSVRRFFHSASVQEHQVSNVMDSDDPLLQELQEKAHLPFKHYLKALWSVEIPMDAWESSEGESITDLLVLGICVLLMACTFPHTLEVILLGVLPCLIYAGYLYVQLCKQILQSQCGKVQQYLNEQKWTLDENRWSQAPHEVLGRIKACRDQVAAFSEAPVMAGTLNHAGNRHVKLPPLRGMGDHLLVPFTEDSKLQAARPEVR